MTRISVLCAAVAAATILAAAPLVKAADEPSDIARAQALRADLAKRIGHGNAQALTYLAAVKEQGCRRAGGP